MPKHIHKVSRIHLAPLSAGRYRRAWDRALCGEPVSSALLMELEGFRKGELLQARRWQLFRPPLALDPVCGRCLRLLGFRHDRERKRGASPAPIRYILDWRDAK